VTQFTFWDPHDISGTAKVGSSDFVHTQDMIGAKLKKNWLRDPDHACHP